MESHKAHHVASWLRDYLNHEKGFLVGEMTVDDDDDALFLIRSKTNRVFEIKITRYAE